MAKAMEPDAGVDTRERSRAISAVFHELLGRQSVLAADVAVEQPSLGDTAGLTLIATPTEIEQLFWASADNGKHAVSDEIFNRCKIVVFTPEEWDAKQKILYEVSEPIVTYSKRHPIKPVLWHKYQYNRESLIVKGFVSSAEPTMAVVADGTGRFAVKYIYLPLDEEPSAMLDLASHVYEDECTPQVEARGARGVDPRQLRRVGDATTKSILVVGFDPIAQLNLVMGLGTAVSRLDMVKLLKEHPSAEVSTCGPDDPILLEYSMVESSESGVRKSKCEASKKIKRLSEPQPKILDEGPPPRRRSRAFRIIPSRSNSMCAICYAEDSNLVMLNPCSHATFCVTCAARLNQCPVCRGIVTGTRRIFFA